MFLMAFVLDLASKLRLYVQDSAGEVATTEFWLDPNESSPAGGPAAALKAALVGMTDGAVTKASLHRYAVEDDPPGATTGPFDRVQDKMKISFAGGVGATMQIPAPITDILMPDGVTLDLSDPKVIELRDSMLDAVTSEGEPLTDLLKGHRRRPARLVKQ